MSDFLNRVRFEAPAWIDCADFSDEQIVALGQDWLKTVVDLAQECLLYSSPEEGAELLEFLDRGTEQMSYLPAIDQLARRHLSSSIT